MGLLKEFEPDTQKLLLRFALTTGLKDPSINPEVTADFKKLQDMAEAAGLPKQLPPIVRTQAVALLKKTEWASHRPIIIGASVRCSEHDT